MRGFEIPVLVVFGSSLAGSINDNVISRCISNLIMVLKEEHAKNLRDSHFYTKREISGKAKFCCQGCHWTFYKPNFAF